ncbi:hypothetical protein JG688_00001761 [Phytophthora aleatoria]|uniref:RNA 3'-terminal phosphate cyclase domain-containing protein n=1 Tax=Phytophthora aleatoria TaxID=2496075 RepID=A0A8J5MI25_9STRA|nr:hypothetical protein JG688_00001761 [Phytophthora aleatoria]
MTGRSLVDIGANLTSGQFRLDLPQVLRRAKQAGVDNIVITGTSISESRSALQLAKHHAASSDVALFTTVGVHPHDAKRFDERSTIAEMRSIITGEDGGLVVAVGECGLDFNRDYSPRDVQVTAFRAQVALACELRMPLFVHEREAHGALVEVLQPFVESETLPPTVVHCFTGDESEMRKYLDMGFYIGLTGFVCMKPRGLEVKNMVPRIPIDQLMIETDAPYMYPYSVGRQKKRARCEPKDIAAVVQTLASCYGITEDEVARTTTENARRFFRLRGQQVNEEKVALPAEAQSENQEIEGSIVLNGGDGEGGGQLLRVATALAAVTQRVVRVHSIRANRKAPGLRNQHLSTIELVAALSAGGKLSVQCRLTYRWQYFADAPSPTIDFMQVPLRTLLARFGLAYNVEVSKRMFFPGGGPSGHVQVSVNPIDGEKTLQAIDLTESSTSVRRVFIRVTAFGSSVNENMAEHYASALKLAVRKTFTGVGKDLVMEVECIVETTAATNQKKKTFRPHKPKERTAVSALVVLETATNGLISLDRTVNVNESTASILADQMNSKLSEYLQSGACVDEHLADNAVVLMALAQAILLNNTERMFVFGGRGAQGEAFRDMFFFDLNAMAWLQVQWTTDCPAGRYGHAVASVDDEKMFVFGGWDGKKSMNDLWVFDSTTFTWRRPKCSGKPPSPRQNLSMEGLSGNEDSPPSLLLYGGYTVMPDALPVYNKDVYVFDVAAMAWSRPRLVGEYPPGTFGQSLNLAGAGSGAELAVLLGGWSGTERTPLFMGDKHVRELVRQESREQRLASSSNQREEKRKKRERKKQHERDLRAASSYARVLDVHNMEWHRVSAYGVAVANRYGHTSTLVGPHLFLFGGWDGNRALNQLVGGELSIAPEPDLVEDFSLMH